MAFQPKAAEAMTWAGNAIDGTVMLAPRAVGTVGNAVLNLRDGANNLWTRETNTVKETTARVSRILSDRWMEYEAMEKLKGTEGFMEKRGNRFGNLWKGIKNTGKRGVNAINTVAVKPIRTGAQILAMTASLAIANPLYAAKDVASTAAGVVHDAADSVIAIGKHDEVYGFTDIQKVASKSYTDLKSADATHQATLADTWKAKKIAKAEAKLAKLKGGDAPAPTAPPAPAPEKKAPDAPAPEKKDAPKEEKKHDTPHDDGEKKNKDIPASSLSATVASLSSDKGYMGEVARIFSKIPLPVHTVVPEIVDTISTRGKTGYGYVGMEIKKDHLYPRMKITREHEHDVETQMHELLHYYTHPYLYAGCYHANGQIRITNQKIRNLATSHYENISNIYERAKSQGYTAINGSSIEDTATEFIANLTHPESVKQLKDIGLYDELIKEVRRLVSAIDTVKIPFEKLTSGEIGPTGKPEAKKAPAPISPIPDDIPDLPPYSGKTRTGESINTLGPQQVFVFGANDQGVHSGGNALAAKNLFGAIEGKTTGYHGAGAAGGTSRGIVTTDIDVTGKNKPHDAASITAQIKELYAEAEKHPDREYLIGYTDKGGKEGDVDRRPSTEMLSGYSPRALAAMFQAAGKGDECIIPSNVIFHDAFAKLFPM